MNPPVRPSTARQIGQVTRAGAGRAAGPVRTAFTPGAERLDDLLDVDAPPAQPGVLERQPSGQVVAVVRTAELTAHIDDSTPHPAYDDLPSLVLLFENRLV